ncbi:MAG: hypothetical protein GY841_00775 [FCB group bacterium]|nr:hypothetical protein [FCB group bacterium]
MKKYAFVFIGILSLALLLTACIPTGTIVITYVVSPDDAGVKINLTDSEYSEGEQEVDLNDDGDFEDIKDNIESIDNIGFYLEVTNNQSTAITFQLLLEPDTSLNYTTAEAAADTVIAVILNSLTVPGDATTTINWNESMGYVGDLEFATTAIKSGNFALYPVALPTNDFDLTIDSLVVIVTITGKP